jgi:hypothetical protein
MRRWRRAQSGVIVGFSICCLLSAGGETNPPISKAAAPRKEGVRAEGTPLVTGSVEQTRQACLQGRRQICGRVLQISSAGLVIESGYSALLRPPLNKSWLVTGTVSLTKDLQGLELNEPGSPCIGLVLLATFPKKPEVKLYDYVVIQGYPAGQHEYSPVPGVQKSIRKFVAGLDTAVQLSPSGSEKQPQRP